jgi:hypothetical protein
MFCCLPAGYTLFVEDEAARANALLSRGDMEGVMVVHLAGRAAEKMVMGEAEVRAAVIVRVDLGWLVALCGRCALAKCGRCAPGGTRSREGHGRGRGACCSDCKGWLVALCGRCAPETCAGVHLVGRAAEKMVMGEA